MSFDAPRMLMMALLRIELPDYVINLCDGGFVFFGGELYMSEDEIFGTVESIENISQGDSDSAPGGMITFLPKSTATAAKLSAPGMQSSRVQMWQVRVDYITGLPVHSKLRFDGKLDFTLLKGNYQEKKLDTGFISEGEYLFAKDEGNTLSDQAHQDNWPGELGLINATNVGVTVAWGVTDPARTSGTSIVRRLFN